MSVSEVHGLSDEAKARKSRAKGNRQPQKKGKQGYLPKERALCIVVYDLGGKPIPTETVDEILNAVNELSLSKGLILNYTQS